MAQIRQLGTALSGSLTGTDDREQHQGLGSPEAVVDGRPGDLYRDITPAAAVIYLKTSGVDTNTGWEAVATEVPASLTSINDGGGSSVVCDTSDVTATASNVLTLNADGGDIVLDTGDGGNISIGSDPSGRIGFHGVGNVVQHASIADATTAVDIIPLFNTLLAAMRDLGLIADLP